MYYKREIFFSGTNYFILIMEMLLLMIFARIAFKRKEESYKATTREVNNTANKGPEPQTYLWMQERFMSLHAVPLFKLHINCRFENIFLSFKRKKITLYKQNLKWDTHIYLSFDQNNNFYDIFFIILWPLYSEMNCKQYLN